MIDLEPAITHSQVEPALGMQHHTENVRLDIDTVASGIRCKSDGRGSGFMVMLGGGTDIRRGVSVLADGDGVWP
jgi:hypothetical protein